MEHQYKAMGLKYVFIGTLILLAISAAIRVDREGILFGRWQLKNIANIRQESGFAFIAATQHSELSSHTFTSRAEVLEDGQKLSGPPNAPHNDIRQIGHGRYSFWHNYVYFATSDNSNPALNKRHYQIFYPWMVPSNVAYCTYATSLLAVAVSLRLAFKHQHANDVDKAWRAIMLVAATVKRPPFILSAGLILTIFLITRAGFYVEFPLIMLNADSTAYLKIVEELRNHVMPHFDIRPPGYPLLIWLSTSLVNRWYAVAGAQTILAFAASLTLAYSVHQMSKSLSLLCAVAIGGFMGSSNVLIYESTIMAESLYTSSLMFAIGLLLLAFNGRRPRLTFALASAVMAFTIIVRPSGLFLIVSYVSIMVYMVRRGSDRYTMMAFGGPFATLLLAFCVYNSITIRRFVISPIAEIQLACATFLYWEPDQRLPADINRAMEKVPETYKKAGITSRDIEVLHKSWNIGLTYPIFVRAFDEADVDGWALGDRFGNRGYLEYRPYIMRVALLSIRKHPDIYAKFVYGNIIEFFDGIVQRSDMEFAIGGRGELRSSVDEGSFVVRSGVDYFDPPQGGGIVDRQGGGAGRVDLMATTLGRLLLHWQRFQEELWHRRIWLLGFAGAFIASIIQLLRWRWRHNGAFLLFTVTSMAIGACLVTCLVQKAMDRYSYPTEFIYYLAIVLIPLLRREGENGCI